MKSLAILAACATWLLAACACPPPAPPASPPSVVAMPPDAREWPFVMLVFFTTHDLASAAAMRELAAMQREHGELVVYAVDLLDSQDEVDRFMWRNELPFPVKLDEDGVLAFDVPALPTVFVLDREGAVLHVEAGFRDRHALRRAVDVLARFG